MFRSTLLVAVTALSIVVSAQNYSTSGPLTIDVSQIEVPLRQSWCRAQTSSCPQICGGQAQPNTCDQETLEYVCTCTDGSTPNITNYDQTIPSFICAQWKANCVANHPMDLPGQTGCLSVTCGSENATSGDSTATTSSASETMTATSTSSASEETGSESASASEPAASATESSAAIALNMAQQYGTGIMGAGLLAVFGLAL
ncbi:hypothetical protein CLAFUW4_10167 [Fulvia fulva]|nr:hypothetical protein CLAFUR4_10171 [Fulvia fulva]KAK4617130.1 hypothetical protein CLAFUR0_10169 [Fulvia fulva]WPV19412.1 hypothetical protein CLAFUW4_10167 [Fulvia fulva]WPV34248.1 hypothetical protein CLAFUW7_10167 [Fulvia fulva]